MYQQERLNEILKIVERHGYVTVKFLTSALHYSNATINRDLNVLEKQKLVQRSYGGVEAVKRRGIALPFRYHKMKAEKLKIGKRAAEFVQDGDTIFIDGSTTAEYMDEFLHEKKNLTVITNNIKLALKLSEYGITVVCLGGTIVEKPSMLSGCLTTENAAKYKVDKMFFSTAGVNLDGEIGTTEIYYAMHTTMAKNAKEVYFLVDHDKLNMPCPMLFHFENLTAIISDIAFPEETKNRLAPVRFEQV